MSARRTPLAVAAAAGSGLLAVYLLAVNTRVGQALDTRIMLAVADLLAGAGWTSGLLGLVSPATLLVALTVLAAAAAAAGGWRAAGAVVATAAGTAAGAVALKSLLVRPDLLDGAANSLPSGHVAGVAGIAAAASLVATPRSRPAVIVLGLTGVTLTGLATLALQWHRPSDVAASALLAIAVAAATRAVVAPGALTAVDLRVSER